MILDGFAVGVMCTRHVFYCVCLCVSVLSLKALLVAQLIFPANQQHEASHLRRPDGRMKRAGDDCEKENKVTLNTERQSGAAPQAEGDGR